MKPGEIRRYKQSSFPLLSAFVGIGQTGQSQTSSFPRLPGNGGQAETRRLPEIKNKIPLVALSQEDRNTNVYQSKNSAKYATDARRERAPDRNHAYRGKRSRGIVDSDLHHKTGPVGGQNSKPLARQKSRRKHEHKCESSSTEMLDENERSSLKDMLENSSKNSVLKRRHKSHVRESAYSVNTVGKVDQRRRIKSCDRSPAKSTKSLLEVKDEFRRQGQQINMTDTEISPKQKQRNTSSSQASKAKRDAAPVASKPPTEKRWKCIMVRHSKKSTPMWVGNVLADSWEEECRNVNNLVKHGKVNNKKENISETNIAKKRGNILKSEALKETEKGASKGVSSLKVLHSADQQMEKGLTKSYRKGEETVKGIENNLIRNNRKSAGLKQNKKSKGKQSAKQVKGIKEKLTDASSKYIYDGKVKRSRAVESIVCENSKQPRNIKENVQKGDESKADCISCSHSQKDMHNVDYNQKKEKKGSDIMKNVVTNHNSKSLKEKDANTTRKRRECKKKHMHGGQVKPDRNKMHDAQEDTYLKNAKETVCKEKKVYMNKTNFNTRSNKSRNGRVLSTSSEKTKLQRSVEPRNSNRNTRPIRTATSESLNSSASTTKTPVPSRRIGTKSNQMNNTMYHTTSKMSTLHSPASPGSKIPVLDRHSSTPTSKRSFASKRTTSSASGRYSSTSTPTSKRSFASLCTTSSVSNAHTERSVNKPAIENTKRQVLRKSPGSESTRSVKASSTKQLVRATPETEISKNKTAATVSRTSAKSVTPISERPASTKASAVMSARSVAVRSAVSLEGRAVSRKSNTQLAGSSSSTSTLTVVSARASTKRCPHTPQIQAQTLARSASYCDRPLSAKSSNHTSRIPVPIKSASFVSRSSTKSTGKPTAAKLMTPVLRKTSSIKSAASVSRRSSVAKHEPTRPASCKHDNRSPDRPVSRTGSSTSAKRRSAVPVLVRSAGANSVSSKRTAVSSASRSSGTSSRSSALSAGHMSTKSDVSSIRSCTSTASGKSVRDSMYDDDFEYESDSSWYSVPFSPNKYKKY